MEKLALSFMGAVLVIALVLACGGLVVGGLAVYALFKWILIPLGRELNAEGAREAAHLARWYRNVTYPQRVRRLENQTRRAIEGVRQDQVALFCAELEALERQREALTASQTAAVRVAVRGR
jgi:hypothetical protein